MVPGEISSEERVLLLKTQNFENRWSTSYHHWKMDNNVERNSPGENLKLREKAITLMISKDFFSSKTFGSHFLGPSPCTTISVQTPLMLWSDNDRDGDIGPGWPLCMGFITFMGL